MVIRPAVPPYSSTTIGDVLAPGLHLPQQRVDRLRLRHPVDRAHDLLDALGQLGLGRLEVAAHDVLEVGDAADVVEVLADHRDPREAGAQEEREGLAEVLVVLDEDHVVARHHHLAHGGVAELEDRVDHLALAGLDQRRRLGDVDHLPQLGLGRERALAEAAAGRDRVADQDQQPRERPEHRGERRQRAGGEQRPRCRRAGGRGCAARRRSPRTRPPASRRWRSARWPTRSRRPPRRSAG